MRRGHEAYQSASVSWLWCRRGCRDGGADRGGRASRPPPPGGKLTKYVNRCRYPAPGIVVAPPNGVSTSIRSSSGRSRGNCIRSCRRHRCGPTTTAPDSPGRRARSGWWSSRRAERRSRPASRTICRDVPGRGSGRHPADTAGRPGTGDDPPARRVRRRRQRRQPGSHTERVRSRGHPARSSTRTSTPDAGLVAVVPRPRPGHAPGWRCSPGSLAATCSRPVRHRYRARPDRHPRWRLRDPAGHPGPPVQPGRHDAVPDQRDPRRHLDRRILRRRHAGQRQGVAVPGPSSPGCTGSGSSTAATPGSSTWISARPRRGRSARRAACGTCRCRGSGWCSPQRSGPT